MSFDGDVESVRSYITKSLRARRLFNARFPTKDETAKTASSQQRADKTKIQTRFRLLLLLSFTAHCVLLAHCLLLAVCCLVLAAFCTLLSAHRRAKMGSSFY